MNGNNNSSYKYTNEYQNMVLTSKFVAFTESLGADFFIANHCGEVVQIGKPLNTVYYSLALNHGNIFKY